MSEQTIAATGDSIRAWVNGPAKTHFDAMRSEVITVCNLIKELKYKGPNAVQVEQGTEESMSALGLGSQEFMTSACNMIGRAAGVILGAGGHMNAAGEFDDQFAPGQFDIPAGGFLTAEDFTLDPVQFRETAQAMTTAYDVISQSGKDLTDSLETIPVGEWSGQARTSAETRFREEIGVSEMEVTPDVLIGAVPETGTPTNLMQAFSFNLSSLANTLYAQVNSAEKADQEAAAAMEQA